MNKKRHHILVTTLLVIREMRQSGLYEDTKTRLMACYLYVCEAKGDVEFLIKLADEAYSTWTTLAVEFNAMLIRSRSVRAGRTFGFAPPCCT
ncbi:hypothetical protein HQN89_20290 [Paenibacillus frigoriresistens]|uniref:hypothetical protein n=1 Tax=Paenibacillus alginolyticus TaxID=59839 RepID=UPI00156567C1|nr:hypothetical protein [Paenibacillus frigoriresistens]NRF93311.1 hypothetical protein [Paenibacillus frigoriresistens]